MKRPIGVFSGTFDPFHVAHLEACLVAKAVLELETVAILVEKKPRRKSGVTDYQTRLAMIDLAIQEYPSLRLIESGHDNITVDTAVPLLEQQFDNAEYWYIVGSDMVAHMEDWQNIDALFESMKLCVVLRHNADEAKTTQVLKKLKKRFDHLTYQILPGVWSPVSSSSIRQEIAQQGYSKYLHRDVLKYVIKHNVY